MDETDAQARLERMVAKDSAPTLSDDEITDLVALARRSDINGLFPADAGWTGTYDLNAAAAEGWRWKAGKVAGGYDFQTDGQTFSRGQLQTHCLAMAAQYARGRLGTIPVGTLDCYSTDVIANVNCG